MLTFLLHRRTSLAAMMAMAVAVAPAWAQETAEQEKPPVSAAAVPEGKSELASLKAQLEKLQAESQLRQQNLEAELASLKAENERLKVAGDLASQKQREALAPLMQEKAKLDAEAALNKARRDTERTPVAVQLETLQQQQQLRDASLAAELAETKAQVARAAAQADYDTAQARLEQLKLQREQTTLAAQNAIEQEKLKAQTLALEAARLRALAELNITQAQVQQRDFNEQWNAQVNSKVDAIYRKEPFKDGVLYVSDRRIDLNGPIISGVADYICNRIDYFNNQSQEAPIFIVIDNCPGGSVMQGYRILKAIESSKAPVHVAVKSFAASMAACITTLAPHSYAYPNAIILHHQMSAGVWGNMTDMEDEMRTMKEWERRLAEPVALKMGISVDEFKKKMYMAKKSGDWDEFADKAVELKWVDTIVQEIREEGIRKKPVDAFPKPWYWALLAQDESGQTYMKLPRPDPKDAYMMYNPNRYYRVDGK